jgi:hypothetical protein
MTPCGVDVAAFTLTIATASSALVLRSCRDHLGAIVVAAFATGGVPVQTVTVARRIPDPA